MPLQTWLAGELRAAGLKVVEVNGWKTRGSKNSDGTYKRFDPIGVQWHATAGSRTSTAAAEVGVLLNGSASAPPPIAQLMIYRDGTIYVVGAGRCNHNLVGWAGPNKGLGNGDLLGIEMANDNRGEPWPLVQLVAARLATAVIMRRIGADPLRRLSGHYEHQPAPPPPGETSTKTDPLGVRMIDERPRVAALMQDLGEDHDMDQATFNDRMDAYAERLSGLNGTSAAQARLRRNWTALVGGNDVQSGLTAVQAAVAGVDEAVWSKISDPATPDEQIAAALDQLLGDRKAAVLALMQQ